jgi:hypothetical protein
MGTNYYSVRRGVDYETPESFWDIRGTEDCIHIGKSSAGWCFSLHVIPEMGIMNLNDWIDRFLDPDRIIVDEYQETVSWDKMIRVITQRKGQAPLDYADPGPNGPSRHKIGHGCLGHGEGTWDYVVGEFS